MSELSGKLSGDPSLSGKLSGDVSTSGDASLSGKLSGDVSTSGDTSYGVELSGDLINIDSETPVLYEWDFDITGFPTDFYNPDENELPFDYQVPGNVYIKIQKYDTNSSELIEFRFYRFQIYRKGFENKTGYLTNEIGYSDPRDCLDAALNFVEQNWDHIFSVYTERNDDLLSADFTQEQLDSFYHNKPSFTAEIPEDVETLYNLRSKYYNKKRKSLSRKILDRVENEVVFKM